MGRLHTGTLHRGMKMLLCVKPSPRPSKNQLWNGSPPCPHTPLTTSTLYLTSLPPNSSEVMLIMPPQCSFVKSLHRLIRKSGPPNEEPNSRDDPLMHEPYIKTGNPPNNADKGWLSKVAWFTLIGNDLYKRGYGQSLLKCVTKEHAQYVIKEIHEGVCGYHSGSRVMTTRILRVDYYWPTMESDCHAFVKKCIPCQEIAILFIRSRKSYISYSSYGGSQSWGWIT